ncbi:hypothetical protein ACONYW_002002 [Escherichia coli]|jgi:hypothetical protein|nr:hypothetical protein [Escherichia coli]
MAQGNWNPDVIKAKPRCRLCRRVVLIKDLVRLDGVNPAHKNCADEAGRAYSHGGVSVGGSTGLKANYQDLTKRVQQSKGLSLMDLVDRCAKSNQPCDNK